jgi:oligopeptide/dipeptide ABC transporter ATP-binding protein
MAPTTTAATTRATTATPSIPAEHEVTSMLEVSGLRTQFATSSGPLQAVRDVSFTLARGQRLAIVGESGSGKSALAMSIVGLVQPPGKVVGGSVKLHGRELVGLSDKQMSAVRGQQISLVFQDPMSGLDPIRSIGSQLVESIRTHQDVDRRQAREQAVDLLGEVGVVNPRQRLRDYPHQYSGGMRQRVLIAMALANSPDLIIADEPTTALDVTTQAQVLDLLTRLVTDRGSSLLLITHSLGVVAGYCDSVKVMYAGELVEEADSTELFRGPGHPYTRELLTCVLRPDRPQTGLLPTIPGALPDLTQPVTGCAFEPRCPLGHGNELCRTQSPPLLQIGRSGTGQARCHFAGSDVQEAS